MLTIFTVAGFLPMFLISPYGGVWADRYNRKYLINIADGAIALASLIVALLIMAGLSHYGILLACAAVRSFGQGVQTPAIGAFIPQIVPREHLTKINGIQGSVNSLCYMTAPMISGVFMTFAPLQIMFFIDVVSAAIGISILVFFVKAPEKERTKEEARSLPGSAEDKNKKATYFNDLREGLKYIKGRGYILRMLVISLVFMIFSAPAWFLTPLQVTRNFGNDVWRLTAMELGYSAGLLAGGILIAAWGGFGNRVFTMAFACFLFGIETVGIGLAPNFWLYIGIIVIAGITMPLYNTQAMVLLQSTVDKEFMGRVLSVFGMVSSTMTPLGMLIFGPVADMININIIFVVTGIVIALLSVPFVSSKTMRKAGRKT
jgi:DHA3 family macrolide efflux protein-like MFS transporter